VRRDSIHTSEAASYKYHRWKGCSIKLIYTPQVYKSPVIIILFLAAKERKCNTEGSLIGISSHNLEKRHPILIGLIYTA
jgi:hypothetical protein